jgi:hypothetical protein
MILLGKCTKSLDFRKRGISQGMTGPYDDIINLPHHVSAIRPQMSKEHRAAQFSPFAALTGHDAAVRETARLTDEKIELGESAVADLETKLNILADMADSHPEVKITYFRPDAKKDGGAYVTTMGVIKRINDYEHAIVLASRETISIPDIFDIESELFDNE